MSFKCLQWMGVVDRAMNCSIPKLYIVGSLANGMEKAFGLVQVL
jgi:NAD(P)H-nitrite reductase large subunit